MTRKRTEITIETDRLLIVRSSSCIVRTSCPECQGMVEMVTPDVAAQIIGISRRKLYQWVEEGELHLVERQEGPPLICLNTLLKLVRLHHRQ